MLDIYKALMSSGNQEKRSTCTSIDMIVMEQSVELCIHALSMYSESLFLSLLSAK